jgi:hypothetical protein
MSTKRFRVLTVAGAGTLTLAAALSVAAAALPAVTSALPASTSDAYLGAIAPAAPVAPARPAGPGTSQLLVFRQVRSLEIRRQQQLTAARAAGDRSAAQAAARKAAARKAAAAQAAAAQATTVQATAAQAATARAAATQAVQRDAVTAPSGSPEQVAQQLLGQFGWSASQFSCLDPLWARESGWNVTAENPSSGAYGIPQALPGSKMASAGADWATDAATQIRWGLTYIKSLYGSPCGAWDHEEADGWY